MSPETAARMLEADRDRLRDALRHQRRLRLAGLGHDPADAHHLHRTWVESIATAAVRDELLDPTDTHRPTDDDDAAALDRTRPGLGALYLEVSELERRVRAEADRLHACREPQPQDGRRWVVLFGKPAGPERRRALLRIASTLITRGVEAGVTLALVESWDAQHNRPPLGPNQAEDIVRWIAARQLQQDRAA